MADERTRPDRETRATEREDAAVHAQADDHPTSAEEAAAERAGPADEESSKAYKEAIERGARQEGEGRIP
jgi:hypothetical protein